MKTSYREHEVIRLNQGLCMLCGMPRHPASKLLCSACLEQKRRQQKTRREAKLKQGICPACTAPVVPGFTRCAKHHNVALARQQKTREKYALLKVCETCGSPEILPVKGKCSSCVSCYLKRTSGSVFGTSKRWQELQEKFNQQQGKCALSGRTLVLGVNTHLDHIIPVCVGGQLTTLENTRWLLDTVNHMKFNIGDTEFFSLIEDIHKCRPQ